MGFEQYEIIGLSDRETGCFDAVRYESRIKIAVKEFGAFEALLTAVIAKKPKKNTWIFRGCFANDESKYFVMTVTFGTFNHENCAFGKTTGTIMLNSHWKPEKTRKEERDVHLQ